MPVDKGISQHTNIQNSLRVPVFMYSIRAAMIESDVETIKCLYCGIFSHT